MFHSVLSASMLMGDYNSLNINLFMSIVIPEDGGSVLLLNDNIYLRSARCHSPEDHDLSILYQFKFEKITKKYIYICNTSILSLFSP